MVARLRALWIQVSKLDATSELSNAVSTAVRKHWKQRMYYEQLLQGSGYRIFMKPESFLKAAADYFKWVDDHPLQEEQIFQHKGAIIRAEKSKMRPYTKKGLAAHLGIPESRLAAYKNRGDEWADAVERIEDIIYTQKFDGAAAGLLNSGIITRDLGLADRQEIQGVEDAPPVSFTLAPIQSGTFLPPEEGGD